jgi:hypothetical protein
VQRWQRIGTEHHVATLRPLIGDAPTSDHAIEVGTEQEWRDESRSYWESCVDRFLRAAYLTEAEFPAFAAAHTNSQDHPESQVRVTRELTRTPTLDERLALCKALYLRAEGDPLRYRGEGLQDQLILECQPLMIERLAQGSFEPPADMGSQLAGVSSDNPSPMLSSATASLARGLVERVASYDSDDANAFDREIQFSCMTIHNTIDTLDARHTEETALAGALLDGALGAVVLPAGLTAMLGAAAAATFLSSVKRLLKAGALDAITRPLPAEQRLGAIRTQARRAIQTLERPDSMEIAAFNTLRTSLRALVDAGLGG